MKEKRERSITFRIGTEANDVILKYERQGYTKTEIINKMILNYTGKDSVVEKEYRAGCMQDLCKIVDAANELDCEYDFGNNSSYIRLKEAADSLCHRL